MAASLLPCSGFSLENRFFPKRKGFRLLQVRSQSLKGEEGKPVNMVDANITVLRERIERLRLHERLQNHCRGGEGWFYPPAYDPKVKRRAILLESLEISGLALAVLGLTFTGGTVTLLLVSLLVHMSQQ